MLTYEKHKMAFTNESSREGFFNAAARGVTVAPGTAREHVLGTNLGIWGSRDALMLDAAKILSYELDSFARSAGWETLDTRP